MTFRVLSIALLFQSLALPVLSQVLTLSGTVRDAVTNSPLPAANIRVLGTAKGTIANSMGVYRLALEKERFTVVYSFIGYRSDTLHVSLEQAIEYSPRLQPSAILMSEVLVTNEDPAIAIMREVIRRKKEWTANLRSYEFEAFTRLVMRFDSAISAITESYTTGYWRQGDTLREVIRQQRKSENLSSGVRVKPIRFHLSHDSIFVTRNSSDSMKTAIGCQWTSGSAE
ncbi:MAG: carboxypeptidase-like regulatory domain-containing protein [Ignavibacteriales bacterium]|nr:carboxypeptidase-like regulatory domain-containing protein [Ignavibacteriales bacterium]